MNASEIRSRFLQFFKARQHAIIPSAPLVTPDDKGVTDQTLFNTAGMQPLVPYLLGKPHPLGKRLANSQKCLRTVDIDDIGDKTHATFFEMLGNWSLGDYFKKEAINWSYEFLTSKEEGLGLDPNRLYVTVFEGDDNAPKDDEAAGIWRDILTKHSIVAAGGDTLKGEVGKIFYMPAANNWWEAGDNGPCGPDSEMYYDVNNKFGGKGITKDEYVQADNVRDVVEIWNDVFMQYEKKDGKIVGKLPNPSVDTGAGLERLALTLQGAESIYDTDLLSGVMAKIKELAKNSTADNLKSMRIVADHLRASTFLMAEGVVPSNTGRGYILRRILRRAVFHSDKIGLNNEKDGAYSKIVDIISETYKDAYPEILKSSKDIIGEIAKEEARFRSTLKKGMAEFNKLIDDESGISADQAFDLYQTYGFPLELTVDLAREKGKTVDVKGFQDKFIKHQELSRAGASQKFKGGLADASDPQVVRYHTATHLLHQALHDVLGDSVMQKGSNITPERLRFDFTHSQKMTDEEKKRVEDIVNEKIKAELAVNKIVMPIKEAEKTGARHFFGEKYGDEVSIYFIGSDIDSAYSKEFCGGPHVTNTKELLGPEGKWIFKIQKEEAVAQGIRRIKAVLV